MIVRRGIATIGLLLVTAAVIAGVIAIYRGLAAWQQARIRADWTTLQAQEMVVLAHAAYQHLVAMPTHQRPSPGTVVTMTPGELRAAGRLPPQWGQRTSTVAALSPWHSPYLARLRIDPSHADYIQIVVTEEGPPQAALLTRSGYGNGSAGQRARASDIVAALRARHRVSAGLIDAHQTVARGDLAPGVQSIDLAGMIAPTPYPRPAVLTGFRSLGASNPNPPLNGAAFQACRVAEAIAPPYSQDGACTSGEVEVASWPLCATDGMIATPIGTIGFIESSYATDARTFCGGGCPATDPACNPPRWEFSICMFRMDTGLISRFEPEPGEEWGTARPPADARWFMTTILNGMPIRTMLCGSTFWGANASGNAVLYQWLIENSPLRDRLCCIPRS